MSERQPITIVLSKAEQDGEIRAMRILMSRYQVEALKAWREIMAERNKRGIPKLNTTAQTHKDSN